MNWTGIGHLFGRHRRRLILAGLLLALALVNVSIWQKESLLRDGEIIYLDLAPVDPRSLMQGDYMILSFQLARSLRQRLGSDGSGRAEPGNGRIRVTVDERGVATLAGLYDGGELAANERLVAYRVRNNRVKLASNAFFFQEGHGDFYEGARYGQFRVAADGELLLTGLYDAQLQRLGPEPRNQSEAR